jgi:uncharacterized Zn-finger protein
MDVSGFRESAWIMRLVVIVWIVSSVFVMFLVNKLDAIVHGELYDYGLQFSFAWATPFWSFERLIYVCLAVPSVLGGIVLVLDFLKRGKIETPVAKSVERKSINGRVQAVKGNSMLISCPKCKKTFGKPLVMLDFSSGKAKLVNVCPYCNARLGDAGRDEGEKDVETRVLGPDEKVKMNGRRRR